MQKTITSVVFWLVALSITIGSAWYQRLTGPTHPYRGTATIGTEEIEYRLIRTFFMPADAPVRVEVNDQEVTGSFRYKRYPSNDDWTTAPMQRDSSLLIAHIPRQPAAGKVMYQISLHRGDETVKLSEDPIVIRFRNSVPAWALLPHVILMFLTILWSTRAGLAAVAGDRTFRLSLITVIFLFTGGMIFGPIVQKYAFGAYWTGWPLGTDLTDNKTAAGLLLWLIALFASWRDPRHRTWVLVAAIGMLIVYLIPHSLLGSEIDWTEEDPSVPMDLVRMGWGDLKQKAALLFSSNLGG